VPAALFPVIIRINLFSISFRITGWKRYMCDVALSYFCSKASMGFLGDKA
jgi:hypothetical protein